MFAGGDPVLANDGPVCISVDFERTPDRACLHRVFVVIEPDKAGLGHRRAHCMEAVEAAAQLHELLPFVLENLPDRAVATFRMTMRLGVSDVFVEEPGVQFVIALEPQARREKALTDQADLVLDLALFPARGRRAGHWLDEIMPAHLKEAAIVLPVLAGEDCLHRGLEIHRNPVHAPKTLTLVAAFGPSRHRPCRRSTKSSPRRKSDVPGDLLCALFGNVTESLHQFDLFRAIPCRNGFTSLLEDKYSLLCRIGKMYPGR